MSTKLSFSNKKYVLNYLTNSLRGCDPYDTHALKIYKEIGATVLRVNNHCILLVPVYGSKEFAEIAIARTTSDRKAGLNNAHRIYRAIYSKEAL